ncbi:MAG TPA: hypothetical protein VK845_16270 [Gemmatimonadales bacterium]|nr:hypothetical protein [Gemmatimonadales bacterium]
MTRAVLMVVAMLVAACSTMPSSPGVPASPSAVAVPSGSLPPATDLQLPTIDLPAQTPCAGIGLDAILHGDPSDPRLAWLVTGGGVRRDIVWPSGYVARFEPDLEVIDATGRVVYRAGDHIDGGCLVSDPDLLLILPPVSTPAPE